MGARSWIALVVGVSVIGGAGVARAQDASVRVEGAGWAYRPPRRVGDPEGDWCAPPCETRIAPGEIELTIAEPGSRSAHRRRVTIAGDATLRVGRWSHEGERIAGGVVLGVLGLGGLAMAIGGAAALGAASGSGDVFAGVGEAMLLGTGIGTAALGLLVGLPLLLWGDEPVVTTATERRETRAAIATLDEARARRGQMRIQRALAVTGAVLTDAAIVMLLSATWGAQSWLLGPGVPAAIVGPVLLCVAIGLQADVVSRRAAARDRVSVGIAPGPGEAGLALRGTF